MWTLGTAHISARAQPLRGSVEDVKKILCWETLPLHILSMKSLGNKDARHNGLLDETQGLSPVYWHNPEVSAAVAVSDQGQPPPPSLGRSRARRTPNAVQIPFSEAEETISSTPLSLKIRFVSLYPHPIHSLLWVKHQILNETH